MDHLIAKMWENETHSLYLAMPPDIKFMGQVLIMGFPHSLIPA